MRKIISLTIFCLLFFSCSKNINIVGQWENDERILEFSEYGGVIIKFKQPTKVQAFQGTFVQRNKFTVLLFEEYKTDDGNWNYTDEINLEGHKEVLQISIIEGKLHTKIVSTGKEYIYNRK